MNIELIPISKIKFDPNQPRKNVDQNKVEMMAKSILTEGVINPVELDKDLRIITGEMRVRAAKLASLKEIPCKIISINPEERFRRQVIENIHNQTMNPMDTARALGRLLKDVNARLVITKHKGGFLDKGIRQLGREIGLAETTLRLYINLLETSKPFQDAVEREFISATMVRVLRGTPLPFKETMEEKILQGQFKGRDIGLEVVAALTRNPENAKRILKLDYSKYENVQAVQIALSHLSPTKTMLVESALAPGAEFLRIKNTLLKWLENNPPSKIVRQDRMLIILGMQVIVEELNNWGREIKQLK